MQSFLPQYTAQVIPADIVLVNNYNPYLYKTIIEPVTSSAEAAMIHEHVALSQAQSQPEGANYTTHIPIQKVYNEIPMQATTTTTTNENVTHSANIYNNNNSSTNNVVYCDNSNNIIFSPANNNNNSSVIDNSIYEGNITNTGNYTTANSNNNNTTANNYSPFYNIHEHALIASQGVPFESRNVQQCNAAEPVSVANTVVYNAVPVQTSNSQINMQGNQPTVSSRPQRSTSIMHMLAQFVAAALNERCEAQRHLDRFTQSVFHSTRVPGISIHDYIRRIAKYSGCSSECFVIAIIFIDRYCSATNVPITFRNIHRLYITALMISAKIRDDIFYSNAYFANIGGVTNREINFLETELLNTISWNTWVEPVMFDQYVHHLKTCYSHLVHEVGS